MSNHFKGQLGLVLLVIGVFMALYYIGYSFFGLYGQDTGVAVLAGVLIIVGRLLIRFSKDRTAQEK